jgi:hypothetical protein
VQVLDEVGLAKAAVVESETLHQAEFLRRHIASTVANAARQLLAAHETEAGPALKAPQEQQQPPQQQPPAALAR